TSPTSRWRRGAAPPPGRPSRPPAPPMPPRTPPPPSPPPARSPWCSPRRRRTPPPSRCTARPSPPTPWASPPPRGAPTAPAGSPPPAGAAGTVGALALGRGLDGGPGLDAQREIGGLAVAPGTCQPLAFSAPSRGPVLIVSPLPHDDADPLSLSAPSAARV